MAKSVTAGVSYAALRKECLISIQSGPSYETIGGIRIVRRKKSRYRSLWIARATTGLERFMFASLPAVAQEQTCREVGYWSTGRRCYQTTLCIIFNLLWARAAIVMIILVGESILGDTDGLPSDAWGRRPA